MVGGLVGSGWVRIWLCFLFLFFCGGSSVRQWWGGWVGGSMAGGLAATMGGSASSWSLALFSHFSLYIGG